MASYGGQDSTPPDDDAEEGAEAKPRKRKVKLPSHSTRLQWYDAWEEQQRTNRGEALRDRDYYDGHQWLKEEIEELEERGQPVTTNNRIAKKVNTLQGEEIERRVDPAGKPRTPAHQNDARTVTDMLRFVSDEQEFPRIRSAVTKSFLIEGIGAAVKRVLEDGTHELHHIEYDRFGYDPHSREVLFGDARYLFFIDWMDYDDAEEMFPGAAEMLETASAQYGESTDDVPRNWLDTKRKRAMVCEMYFWVGGDCYRSFFTKAGDLRDPERCEYEDEKGRAQCPLLAVSCYIDREGNRYGVVRNLRSPQDRLNKFESKTQHLLNSNQIFGEDGSVASPEELRDARAQPDGMYFGFAPGALQNGAVEFQKHIEIASGFVQLSQQALANLDGSGPSASNLPELPAGASGRAQAMRRKAAALDYGTIFDHLRWWSRAVWKLDFWCARQTWTEEKWIRVTDDKQRTGHRFVGLNRKMTRAQRFAELMQEQPPPDPMQALESAAGVNIAPVVLYGVQLQMQQMQATGAQMPPPEVLLPQLIMGQPLMQELTTVNDVANMVADIVLDEAPDTAVLAEEQFQTLTELSGPVIQARPDMAETMAKAVVKASSLPDKRDIEEAFDKKPGADPQAQQMQAQMQQLQQKMLALEAALKEAQVQKTQADAQLSQARAQTELASLSAPQGAPGPGPLEHAKARREEVNTHLDVELAHAQVEKDRSAAAKNMAGAAASAHQMMQPEPVEEGVPDGL